MTMLETATEQLEKDVRLAWRMSSLGGSASDLVGCMKLVRSTVSVIVAAAKHEGAMEVLARVREGRS